MTAEVSAAVHEGADADSDYQATNDEVKSAVAAAA
jgi:hypothetical protein